MQASSDSKFPAPVYVHSTYIQLERLHWPSSNAAIKFASHVVRADTFVSENVKGKLLYTIYACSSTYKAKTEACSETERWRELVFGNDERPRRNEEEEENWLSRLRNCLFHLNKRGHDAAGLQQEKRASRLIGAPRSRMLTSCKPTAHTHIHIYHSFLCTSVIQMCSYRKVLGRRWREEWRYLAVARVSFVCSQTLDNLWRNFNSFREKDWAYYVRNIMTPMPMKALRWRWRRRSCVPRSRRGNKARREKRRDK